MSRTGLTPKWFEPPSLKIEDLVFVYAFLKVSLGPLHPLDRNSSIKASATAKSNHFLCLDMRSRLLRGLAAAHQIL